MSLVLTVPDEIADAAKALSQRSGKSAEELLLRALRAHFPPIPADLVAEFDAWEQASDEDEAVFQQRLNEAADGAR